MHAMIQCITGILQVAWLYARFESRWQTWQVAALDHSTALVSLTVSDSSLICDALEHSCDPECL